MLNSVINLQKLHVFTQVCIDLCQCLPIWRASPEITEVRTIKQRPNDSAYVSVSGNTVPLDDKGVTCVPM